ncbi:DsbA family oxidoreductase [Haploplasma modicum]|uniref:DsbA family oxidoreductase n=1 Tax=Haploplasma modicum TaxID=2150 RepID=UPI00047B67AA|nr:DsbA family protein [Haploplasma modicum]
MRIEFWVDYLCPITYLTHKNLIEAIDELKLEKYDLLYRSYKLDEPLYNQLKQIPELIKIVNENIPTYVDQGFYDTDYVHQLAHLAKWNNLAKEFNVLVFHEAYVNNNKINDVKFLEEVAKKINLDLTETRKVLDSCCYNKQISSNKENAKYKGIIQVPHLRINIKHNYNGYYSKQELKNIISHILEESKNPKTECSGEFCNY